LITNGLLIGLFYRGTEQVATLNHLLEQDSRNKALWMYFSLRASIPVLGIQLAAFSSRFAKWVNVGLLAYFGVAFLVTGIWNWSEYHGHIFLLLGPLALVVAGFNLFLFRRSKSVAPQPSL
jgi:hypothetical protein